MFFLSNLAGMVTQIIVNEKDNSIVAESGF